MLGGAGSDLIEGRGGDDLIDGDAWLDVQLQAPGRRPTAWASCRPRWPPARSTRARSPSLAPSVPGAPGSNDFDTAVFSGPRADYDFTPNADSMTVVHARGTTLDGTDTVDNVERLTLRGRDGRGHAHPGQHPGDRHRDRQRHHAAHVARPSRAAQAITDPDVVNAATLVFSWQAETAPNIFTTVATGATFTPTADQAGQRLRVVATFQDGDGVTESVTSAPTAPVGGGVVVVAAPSVTPASGTVTSGQAMTITTAAGTTVRYTVGAGTTVPADPTSATGTAYSTAVPITSSQIVKAAAFDAAGNRSPIVQRNYTIAAAGTRTVTVPVAADSMARQATPTTTAGGVTPLIVDSQATTGNAATRVTSYLRFTVPALNPGETITAASLSLLATDPSDNGPVLRRAGNTTWTEAALHWDNQPLPTNTTAVGNFGAMTTANLRYSTAVSGITTAGDVSLQLFAESTNGMQFASKENTTVANRPQLVLTISGGGAGPVTVAAPSVTPASGTVTSGQAMTITTAAGTTVRYTVGAGTTVPADPTSATGTAYSTAVPITSSQIVKAAAFDAAGNRSPIVQRNYTIAAAGTRTVTVPVAADSMARQATPTTTAGGVTPLIVDSQATTGNAATRVTSYLRFTVPALNPGETITAASLSLLATDPSDNGPVLRRAGNTTWTEAALHWDNQPLPTNTTAVGNFGAMTTANLRYSTAVSGITTAGDVSLQLFAESTNGMQFASKENTTVANRPQLVLTIRTG